MVTLKQFPISAEHLALVRLLYFRNVSDAFALGSDLLDPYGFVESQHGQPIHLKMKVGYGRRGVVQMPAIGRRAQFEVEVLVFEGRKSGVEISNPKDAPFYGVEV